MNVDIKDDDKSVDLSKDEQDGLRFKSFNANATQMIPQTLTRLYSKEFYNPFIASPRNSSQKKSAAIFGDPWGTLQIRNKDFVKHISAANTVASKKMEGIEYAIILFNEKPDKGVKYCIDHGFFPARPDIVVNFLLHAHGLSKFAIGQYLASPDPFNQEVLAGLAKSCNLKDVPIDEALRSFLKLFRLPGEADQIDRVIAKFSNAFILQNPVYENKGDQIYLLAYSLIMLNTLNHNPRVNSKMRLTEA